MHPLTTRILHQQQSSSKHRNITQNYVQHQNSSRHVPVHWNPFSKGTTCWGECTYKGIPILPQHFPLYSSREVVPLLPYLLHLWAMHTLYVNEGIAIARGVYFLLDHTCTPPRMLHVWTLIDKKNIYIILNTVYTCTLEVNRLFLNINVTLMSGHSTHGPWCHCLLLVSGTGGGGISYPHCYHPAYPSPQEHHVNVCPPQYRTSNKHNSNT